jgi:hypothetical protein
VGAGVREIEESYKYFNDKEPKPLQRHVGRQEIANLLRETESGIKLPEVQHFQFVVMLADDTNPQEVPATISK